MKSKHKALEKAKKGIKKNSEPSEEAKMMSSYSNRNNTSRDWHSH